MSPSIFGCGGQFLVLLSKKKHFILICLQKCCYLNNNKKITQFFFYLVKNCVSLMNFCASGGKFVCKFVANLYFYKVFNFWFINVLA